MKEFIFFIIIAIFLWVVITTPPSKERNVDVDWYPNSVMVD